MKDTTSGVYVERPGYIRVFEIRQLGKEESCCDDYRSMEVVYKEECCLYFDIEVYRGVGMVASAGSFLNKKYCTRKL